MLYYILVPLAWLVWHIAFRIRVVGRENLIWDRGFLLAPNHISAIDPVFVIIARFWGRKMLVFAKRTLFEKNVFLSWFLRQAGGVAVRGSREDVSTVDDTIEKCRAGRGLLIFPEGTRTKTGEIGPLKSGLFVIAAQAKVDVVPCRILYDTPDGFMKLGCRVRVCFGKPIPAAQLELGEKRDIKKLRENKQRLLDAWNTLYEENRFENRRGAGQAPRPEA